MYLVHASTNVPKETMAFPAPLRGAQPEGEEDERVAAEIAAMEAVGAVELYLNYRHLRTIPAALVGSQYCQTNLQRLYLKRNIITEVVRPCSDTTLCTCIRMCMQLLINNTISA